MSKKSRDKGKRGERLIIDWLQPICDAEVEAYNRRTGHDIKPIILQRNTVQSDRGGSDLCGLPWLAAEVKNCETQTPGLFRDWWAQTVTQAAQWGGVPVLFYTRARQPIRVRMEGGWGNGLIWAAGDVDISAEQFEQWFKQKLNEQFDKNNP